MSTIRFTTNSSRYLCKFIWYECIYLTNSFTTICNESIQNGDEYVHKFSVPSANYHQELPFKLGEQRTGQYRGKDFTVSWVLDYQYTHDEDLSVRFLSRG